MAACMSIWNGAQQWMLALHSIHLAKEGYPTRVFEVVCDHAGRILCATPGFPGTWNDKTIARTRSILRPCSPCTIRMAGITRPAADASGHHSGYRPAADSIGKPGPRPMPAGITRVSRAGQRPIPAGTGRTRRASPGPRPMPAGITRPAADASGHHPARAPPLAPA